MYIRSSNHLGVHLMYDDFSLTSTSRKNISSFLMSTKEPKRLQLLSDVIANMHPKRHETPQTIHPYCYAWSRFVFAILTYIRNEICVADMISSIQAFKYLLCLLHSLPFFLSAARLQYSLTHEERKIRHGWCLNAEWFMAILLIRLIQNEPEWNAME